MCLLMLNQSPTTVVRVTSCCVEQEHCVEHLFTKEVSQGKTEKEPNVSLRNMYLVGGASDGVPLRELLKA